MGGGNGQRNVFPCPVRIYTHSGGKGRGGRNRGEAHLLLYVTKIDIQLLQQTGLALVSLSGEGSDPARLQPALLAHAARDTTRRRPEAKVCAAAASGRTAVAAI